MDGGTHWFPPGLPGSMDYASRSQSRRAWPWWQATSAVQVAGVPPSRTQLAEAIGEPLGSAPKTKLAPVALVGLAG